MPQAGVTYLFYSEFHLHSHYSLGNLLSHFACFDFGLVVSTNNISLSFPPDVSCSLEPLYPKALCNTDSQTELSVEPLEGAVCLSRGLKVVVSNKFPLTW